MTSVIPFNIDEQKVAAAKLVESVSISTLTLAAKTLEVLDEESYRNCIDLRGRFAAAEKKILDFWKPLTEAAHTLHKAMTGAREEMARPYVEGKALTTKKAEAYLNEQRRQKRESEAALARAADQERLRLEQEARDLAMRGRMKEAEQIAMRASLTVAPTLPSAVPAAAGAKVGDKFTGKVTDLMAVLGSIVDGRTPLMWEVRPGDVRPLVVVDEVVLRAIVSRQQRGLQIPGVAVEEGSRISSMGVR